MAKQIKAIQCPKCGSTDKIELKPDYFGCNNCNTEYFLDNDDININHNVSYNQPDITPPTPNVNTKKQLLFAALGFALLLLFILPTIFRSSSSSSSSGFSAANANATVSWSNTDKDYYSTESGKPILVLAGKRSYKDDDDVPSVAFIDLEKQKEIKVQQLGLKVKGSSSDFKIGHFSNGAVYVLVDKMRIYEVNKQDYTLADVTASLFAQQKEMSSGIANAEFMYESEGEGFKVINNEGLSYFYYPLIDKLMTKEQKYAAKKFLESKVVGEKLVTSYSFTSKSRDYPEMGIQLIQYTKKDNAGGVNDVPYFEWGDRYFDNKKQKTITTFGFPLIRSWKDFTPDHKYFNPKLKYFDKDVVIFTKANTPAENAPKSLQCLDANTGAIKWTLLIDDKYIGKIGSYKDGFMIDANLTTLLLTKDGKIKSEYKNN